MKRWSVSVSSGLAQWSKRWLKRPRVYWIGGGTLALTALAELLFGFGMPIASMPWDTYKITQGAAAQSAPSTGTVEAYERAILFAQASGTVESVFRQSGDIVRKGDLLATLSNPGAARTLQENEQALAMAREAIRPALISASPEVIRSPASGRVIKLNAQAGAAMDDGALAVVAEGGALRLASDVASAAHVGQAVTVESGTVRGEGAVSAIDGDRIIVRTTDERFKPGSAARALDAVGTVIAEGTLAADSPAVIFGVSGVIHSVHVEQGGWVNEGDPIFTLEGPLSLPGYDAQLKTIEQLIIARNESQDVVNALSIYAPEDGLLSGLAIKAGDSVKSGQALGTLTDPDNRVASLPVSEQTAQALERGQNVSIEIEGVPGAVNAVIASIDIRQDISGAKAFARAVIPYTEDVRIGAGVSALLENSVQSSAISVPSETVLWADGSPYVLRVPETSDMPFSIRRLRGPIGWAFYPDTSKLLESIADKLRVPVTAVPLEGGSYEITGGVVDGTVILRNAAGIARTSAGTLDDTALYSNSTQRPDIPAE